MMKPYCYELPAVERIAPQQKLSPADTEVAAILEAVVYASRGEPVSDFMESFPVVRSVVELHAEVSRLTIELKEANAVCVCGCPEAAHENYGEDGEACEHEDHQCVRTNRAVLTIIAGLTTRLATKEERL